ncbi:dihydrofolate reductase [candidate division KSB3 bacterium]|uniref:Dihydrofolate reductase n=1 Tax=candidate division KSB3 bacterium TaxID=2044937 RepID=A0A2G6EGT0_9BACT|nr:MAG: dihydrofolate reductase [candidate division KSB3 bacterium]PIE31111.1 MAG: dihydrofolate reductase [candidate division KSB3 bacterium]
MKKFRVLITCTPMIKSLSDCREHLEAENFDIVIPKVEQQLSEEELFEMIADFDGVISGDDPFTERVLKQGRQGRLRAVVKWGIGLDAIDLDAARRLDVFVSNTPGTFNDEVADAALTYIMLLARETHLTNLAVRRGEWRKKAGVSLRGKVAGIIGVGNIGSSLARRLHVLGMDLLGYDPYPINEAVNKDTGLRQVELDELFSSSDCISLCCGLSPENYHLLNTDAFRKMKKGVWIVNVARGPLIDENALLEALKSGKVAGAGLDVFESEPVDPNHPLFDFDQVIAGSHNASNTKEAVSRVNRISIEILARELRRIAGESNQ